MTGTGDATRESRRRLLLIGAGHAHVHVLRSIAEAPIAGVDTVLVTPWPRQVYSGMVPGWVAGHYDAADCAIPVAPLVAAAGVRWIAGAAASIDPAARRVVLADGAAVGYDAVSIDTGAGVDAGSIAGAREHALFVRPIERFVQSLEGRLAALPTDRDAAIAVIGAGAAGIEIALALRHRSTAAGSPAAVTLLTGGPPPLPGYADRVVRRATRALAAHGVAIVRDTCTAVEPGVLVRGDGTRIACDIAIVATGAGAPAWVAGSGLALDAGGCIRTGSTLQSVSHADVFAAGDAASRDDLPHPRSGVFAVRAGPPLAANLRRWAAGDALQPHCPRLRTLYLISCGEKRAIASWGRWSAEGRWAWWWKDRIDRGFVARYTVGGDAARGGATPAA